MLAVMTKMLTAWIALNGYSHCTRRMCSFFKTCRKVALVVRGAFESLTRTQQSSLIRLVCSSVHTRDRRSYLAISCSFLSTLPGLEL